MPKSADTVRTSPIAPAASSSRMRTVCGRKRVHIASMQKTPAARAAPATSAASSPLIVNGFSTSTCLPAAIAASAFCACSGCGVAT